jgi:hypothetical protein
MLRRDPAFFEDIAGRELALYDDRDLVCAVFGDPTPAPHTGTSGSCV